MLLELRQRRGVLEWFAQRFAVQLGNLIRTDHDAVRSQRVDSTSLGQREPKRGLARRFAGQYGFVHVRGLNVELQVQALQQFASVTRRRGEYDLQPGHGARSVAASSPPTMAPG